MHFTIFTFKGVCLRGYGKFIEKVYMLHVVNNESGSGERDILNRAGNVQALVFNDCTVMFVVKKKLNLLEIQVCVALTV